MCKILFVEDEVEKRRIVSASIMECDGVYFDDIVFVSDVYEAKRQLVKLKFDLLILDINIPKRADQAITVGGGLDILSFIRSDPRAIVPSYVIGLTAYDDGAMAAQAAFEMPLWKLITFSFQNETWKKPIQEAVRYINSNSGPPYFNDGKTYHTDIAIIVALEDVELTGIRRLPIDWKQFNVPHDSSCYLRGVVKVDDQDISLVAVAAPRMGLSPAAVTASKLISNFRPRVLAMTGICAGVRGKVEQGDILVADPCFDWGAGKWIVDPSGSMQFLPAAYQWRLDDKIRSLIRSVSDEVGLLGKIHASFQGPKPRAFPKVLIDAMASGSAVLQSEDLMQKIREQHKNLIGLEMESYAIFCAAEYAASPRPICISMKSVCDFGDSLKNDNFHEYAAHTSSNFIFELIKYGLINKLKDN